MQKRFLFIVTLLVITFSSICAQQSINLGNIKINNTEYSKTGFVEISALNKIVHGSGKNGVFIDGKTVRFSRNYLIGKYTVTQELYNAVMNKSPSSGKANSCTPGENQELRPVEQVSYIDVATFCNKLSSIQGLEPVFIINGDTVTFDITKNGWRIPTEAEWEFAARGGNPDDTATWNNLYYGAKDASDALNYAWMKDNSTNVTHEVGLKRPNKLGIYDMFGNVLEWCLDWNASKEPGDYTDPVGPTTGTERVYRGCSKNATSSVNLLTQGHAEPTKHYNNLGFRLCRTVPAATGTISATPNQAKSSKDIGVPQKEKPIATPPSNGNSQQTDTTTQAINLDNIKLNGTEYKKTDFAYIGRVIIDGNGSEGAFTNGRTVTLRPYIIGKYPVTQELYEAVAIDIPDAYTTPSKGKSDTLTAGETQGLRPVEQVDFFEVVRFCNKLSELQGLEQVFTINGDTVTFDITKNGWRIPTEAEWECAARGGNPNDFVNWNNLLAGARNETDALNYAWIKTNSNSVTHEVGLKKPNSLGLYDMLGNVYVWCIDLSDSLNTGKYTNPTGATSGKNRVQRGCSKSSANIVKVTKRDEGAPEKYWSDVGFRLCRTVTEALQNRPTLQLPSQLSKYNENSAQQEPTQTTQTSSSTGTASTSGNSAQSTTPGTPSESAQTSMTQTTPATSQTASTTTNTSTAQTSTTTTSAAADRIENGVLYIKDGTTEIKGSAYRNNNEITKVVIPSTVTKIGELAFQTCGNLKEVEIPASVKTIGNAAFQNCKKLTKVTLNEGLTTLNYRAFKGSGITDITIPASVTTIGNEVVAECGSLTAIRVTYGSKAHTFFKSDNRLVVIGAPAQTTQPAATSGATQLDPTGWKKDDFTTSWKEYYWEFPVEKFKTGTNTITFTYKSGGYKLCLKDVEIIADGRTILTDAAEKSAGANPKSAVYTITLATVPQTFVMKANARTSGGTNSVGTITVAFIYDDATATVSSVRMSRAGTLASALRNPELKVKITGPINGTDIKYLRELINAEKVISLDLSDATIVSGGEAYYEEFTTSDNIIGESMFYECKNLQYVILPTSATSILKRAFSRTGLKSIDIPNNYTSIGFDAFGYCGSLETVVISNKASNLEQGVFYSTKVKNAYVKAPAPPTIAAYLFSSKPTIYVYSQALDDYKESEWANFGTPTGGLENIYPNDIDPWLVARSLLGNYFKDSACTTLKNEYARMNDRTLTTTMANAGFPQYIIDVALKVKNNRWAEYEKEFRIHSYKAYSDASYWNGQLKASGGSYMGNPTGIYAADESPICVFVDQDIPDDATLYFRGCTGNTLIGGAKTGQRLSKGLNVIPGKKDALYYVIYTADTKSKTKKLSEWPAIKIHIEGGVVNGYYDVSRHSDNDYVNILKNATHELFTVKGEESIFNFKTETYRKGWPSSIEKSIRWFDSLTVREKEVMGFCESVATGNRAGYPLYLTGGDSIFPIYYNNPNFAIEGPPADNVWANSAAYRTEYNSQESVLKSFVVTRNDHDDWCAAHECGHNNQAVISLEGCTEVSNNLFSNIIRFTDGTTTTSGESISTMVNDYTNHVPFFTRDIWSMTRMYYQLYLYYHQAQRNTSFYPTLFKEFREDPMKLWNDTNQSSLKFVRKVCEVAQEDLTDFFTVWGFFEPGTFTISDYGTKTLTVTQEDINSTLEEISKYPKKSPEILFIEDRIESILTTDFLTTPGKVRLRAPLVGQYGDLGQFSDYLPDVLTHSNYTYTQVNSEIAMNGTGAVGFFVKNSNGKLLYASNKMKFQLPENIGNNFVIYSVYSDGTLYKATKINDGTVNIFINNAGTLGARLTTIQIDDLTSIALSGHMDSYDISVLERIINNYSLVSIDLSAITALNDRYSTSYKMPKDTIGESMFANCANLQKIILPPIITSILGKAFSYSGLKNVEIPNNVTSIGFNAFSYCNSLETVVIGSKVTQIEQKAFYNSAVKDVYVYAEVPPTIATDFFTSNPKIHVYARSLAAYKASNWAYYGTLVGDL